MSFRKYLLVGVPLLLILVAGYFIYGASKRDSDAKHAEQTFMREMVAHHEAAISLAAAAKDQSTNDDVRLIAASIITTHQQDIETMRGWYKKWYGIEVPKSTIDPHAGHAPESNASTLEEGFASIMIPHQEKGVTIARAVLNKSKHKEVTALAYTMIDRMSGEIDSLKAYKPASKPSATAPTGPMVMYTDKGFDKPQLIVTAGTTVTFMNARNGRPMWVASNVHPEHTIYPEFDQGRVLGYEPLPKDSQFSFTFTKKGKWVYHDHYDPGRQGTVIVN